MSRKRKKRKKTCRKNLKWDNTWNENTNALLDDEDFNLHKFRLDIVYITRDQLKRWDKRDTWHTETDEGRIKLMLEDRKSKSLYKNYYLSNALTRVLKSVLDRVYTKYFGEKRMSKKARTQELTFAFYDEESPMDKREVEEDNIEAIGNLEEEFNFFELCNILLPKEIIFQIFEFLDRNYDILTTVGTICQHFYVHLLSTWNHIKVTERNLYKISLIALKTSKSMKIGKLTKQEQDYLWSKIGGNKRLRRLEFGMTALNLRSTFAVLQALKKKRSTNSTNYPAENVQEIHLGRNMWGKARLLKNSSFNQIFPNLRKVRGSLSREFELKMFQNSPVVDHIIFEDVDERWKGRYSVDRIETAKKYIDVSKIKKFGVHEFQWSEHSRKSIVKYLNFFQSVQYLHLRSAVNVWGGNSDFKFDMSKLFSSTTIAPELKELSIIDTFSTDSYYSDDDMMGTQRRREVNGDQSIPVIYSTDGLNKIEKLKIISFKERYTFMSPLDFNLEELLSSNFLLNNPSLKSFIGDVPLFKRSRCLSLIQKDETKNFEEEMEKLMQVVHNFMKFLTDSMVSEFNHFEVTIRSRDLYFKDETIKFIYSDKHSIQGIKVIFGGARANRSGWSYNQIVTYTEQFVKPLFWRTRYDSTFDEHNSNTTSCSNTKVFLVKEKRPCLLLLMYFLEKAMNQMQNQIDVFCFDFECLKKSKKSVKNSWRKVMLRIVEERGEKYMKDFVFDEENLSLERETLV